MFSLSFTNQFKKDSKLCIRRKYEMANLQSVLTELESIGKVQQIYKPHTLNGNYAGCWECHIENDWLLIWELFPDNEIHFIRTGAHSDIFG